MHLKRRSVLLVLLIILLVIFFQLRQELSSAKLPVSTLFDRVLVSLFTPVQKGIDKFADLIGNSWSGYLNLIGVKKENNKLKEELAFKKLYILSLEERLRIERHEKLIEQKMDLLGWEGIPARVISFDPYAKSHTLWISAGSKQGIHLNRPVITLEGLVGRVVKVFDHSSQILLLVDSRFSVDVIDEETRVRALVVGSGKQAELRRYPYLTHLEFLNLGDEIYEGDLLVTSGLGPLYPKGIPVGNVIRIQKKENALFQTSVVLPVVDFSKLDQVMVLK